MLQKILRPDPDKKSRFHTGRGDLLPIKAWQDVPMALFSRLKRERSDGPWMTPAAVEFLDKVISPNWSLFEYGSGASTVWYATRAASVISVEDSEKWYRQVVEKLSESGVSNCELRHIPGGRDQFIGSLEEFENDSFDMVIVDGLEVQRGDRMLCLEVASRKVKPGGYIALDDSDRLAYGKQGEILSGWKVRRFPGMKPRPLSVVETSIFEKPQ